MCNREAIADRLAETRMGGSLDQAGLLELALRTLDGHAADPESFGGGRIGREVEVVAEAGGLLHIAKEGFRPLTCRREIRSAWYGVLLSFL